MTPPIERGALFALAARPEVRSRLIRHGKAFARSSTDRSSGARCAPVIGITRECLLTLCEYPIALTDLDFADAAVSD